MRTALGATADATQRTMKDLPLSKVYQLLEPDPEPPLLACIVSSANHSFTVLRATNWRRRGQGW
jgi:hypothetical protein